MTFLASAQLTGAGRVGARCTARTKQGFKRSHPPVHGTKTISLFFFIDLEASIVIVEIEFIRPIEPGTFPYVAGEAKSSTDIALSLQSAAVIEYGAVERWDWTESLTDQHLIDQCVAITEEERRQ